MTEILKFSTRTGLGFIKKTIKILKYENLIRIIGMTENSVDCTEKFIILDIVNREIKKRDEKYNRKHNICLKN